jgi:hypothetical protein
MDTIVVCAVLQDAAPGLLEWIAFHRLIGVDRFVLYDLGSTDGADRLIARSRFNHQATVIDWSHNDGPEAAYADFVANHANHFTWAAVIAQDEFLHPLETDTIRSLLPRYDGFAAVLLQRLTFVASDHQARPGQLVIGNHTNRVPADSPLNDALPTLLRTTDLQGAGATPGPALLANMCNARGERVPAEGLATTCDDVMVVNRYRGQSATEGRAGSVTGNRFAPASPGGTEPGQPLRGDMVQTLVPDRRITRFIPRLRAMLHDASLATQPQPAQPPATATPSRSGRPLTLGIGIVTCNRRAILSETLDRVMQHTKHPQTILAVADDGSSDGTLDMLRARQVLTVSGRNMNIAWNKNRALFLLSELLRCDVVVLLEDDAYPSRDNWELEWIAAAVRWGHANVAAQWLREHSVAGTGTVDDPIQSQRLTGQCAVFSREALLFGGYFDTRFREYGHEHVEHTLRLVRMGYGGTEDSVNGQPGPFFKLLWGGIGYHAAPPVIVAKDEQAERNQVLAQELFADFSYRAPWRNEDEARQLREEMRHSFPRTVL